MSGHQTATIGDTVYFWFAANDTSGSGGDGATPLYDVREAGAAAGAIPLLSGAPTLLTHANFPAGCYEIAVAATGGNDFAADDTFAVFCTLLVDSQNPSGFVGSCTLTPLAKTSEIPSAAAIVNEWESQSQADPTGFHVNMMEANSDTGMAANFALGWNGTGVVGDEFPAKQSQVTNLTVAGSANKVPANLSPNGFVITWGENEANTEDATRPLDGTTHDIEAQNDTGTEKIDVYYEMSVGAGIPSEVTWHGRLDRGGGASKNIDVQVEDVDASTWRTIGNIISSNSLETHTFDIFINEVGTGGDLGTVRIRFVTGSVAFTATTKLLTDQIFVSFNAGTISSLDSVYFDSAAGNTGTTSNDGVPGNPVSTEAAVNTLLAARNLNRVSVAIGSSVTFATAHTGEEWIGDGWTLGLGAQNLASSLFIGATVSGTHTGAVLFNKCELGTISTAGMTTDNCGHTDTITITAAGTYIFNNNHSEVAGATTPVIDMGAAVGNVNLAMPDYHNGIEIQNFNATGTDEFSISGIGQIIYAASSSGTVNQRGDWKVTNTGGVTITADDNTTNLGSITGAAGALLDSTATSAQLVDDVLDEVNTGAAHNVGNSLGRQVRETRETNVYADSRIWIDTVNGAAGTTDYENGTLNNPVNSIADANTLATSLGFSRFMVLNGSSITFAAAQASQNFLGDNWTLALGGQNIAGTKITGATVSGIASGAGTLQIFEDCRMGATSHIKSTHLHACSLSGDQTLAEAGDIFIDQCHSAVAGMGTVTFDFGAALNSSNLNIRHHSGGWTIENMGAGTGTYNASFEGNGQIVWAASCSATSNASIRGNWKITDNASGAVTETLDDNQTGINAIPTTAMRGTDSAATEAKQDAQDAIITEVRLAELDAANLPTDIAAIPTTAMRGTDSAATEAKQDTAQTDLDTISDGIITGTAATGTLSTTQCTSNLSGFTDDQLIGRIITFLAGPADGESSDITDYASASGLITFTAMTLAPENGNAFKIT